jgi:hypothetical protein
MPIHNQFIRDLSGNLSSPGLVNLGAFSPIEIHIPPQIAQIITNSGQPMPNCVTGVALIDTGASSTCVHEPILRGLGLNPVGVVNTGTAGGPQQQNVYPVRIVCPTQGWALDLGRAIGVDLTGQILNKVPPEPIIALLGRDLLQDWVFIYNGPGGFWTISR